MAGVGMTDTISELVFAWYVLDPDSGALILNDSYYGQKRPDSWREILAQAERSGLGTEMMVFHSNRDGKLYRFLEDTVAMRRTVVEILTQCPTYFGRKNRLGDAVDMLNWYKDHTTPIGSEKKQKDPSLIERGIFVQEKRPEYCEEYEKIVARAKEGQQS